MPVSVSGTNTDGWSPSSSDSGCPFIDCCNSVCAEITPITSSSPPRHTG